MKLLHNHDQECLWREESPEEWEREREAILARYARAAMDLNAAMTTRQDYYSAMLFRLIAKADSYHLHQLSLAYPLEVEVYMRRSTSESQLDFDRWAHGRGEA